jgi:hypothetical protein
MSIPPEGESVGIRFYSKSNSSTKLPIKRYLAKVSAFFSVDKEEW